MEVRKKETEMNMLLSGLCEGDVIIGIQNRRGKRVKIHSYKVKLVKPYIAIAHNKITYNLA